MRTHHTKPRTAASVALRSSAAQLLILLMLPSLMIGQETPAPAPLADEGGQEPSKTAVRSATGLALPNVPIEADLNLAAPRVTTWREGTTDHLLLEGGTDVAIGSYRFRSERAVVVVEQREFPGIKAWQIAIYLDQIRSLGGSTVSAEAPRLLVTAVIKGKVNLTTDSLRTDPATDDELVAAARGRIDRHRDALARNTEDLPEGPPLIDPEALAERDARRTELDKARARVGVAERPEPDDEESVKGPAAGQVSFRADELAFEEDKEAGEGYVKIMGNIVLMFPEGRSGRVVTLRADNAVIFTDPDVGDRAAGGALDQDRVRGIYLEDNVIVTDGQYTFRGPRVFYDVRREKALVLDAVFFAWDTRRRIPLYVRAKELRQQARGQWSASEATFTTSEFAEPHFAIGVNKLTVTESGGVGIGGYNVQASGVTLRAADVPVFYWPSMSGDATEVPLRRIDVGHSTRLGAFVRTRWDLFSLLNRTAPTGVEAQLLVDGFTERGPGTGVTADYDVENAFGELDAYYLYDTGTDKPGGRDRVEPDSENRGRVSWRHRHELPENWEATVELAWISDPNFLEEFYSAQATTEKEQETLLYFKQQQDDWAFTFLTKYDLLDFVPQPDLMQTRGNIEPPGGVEAGYTTQKIPEVEYYRIATPLWDNRLTWYSENRASLMRLNLPEDSPRERGFNAAESTAIFGIASAGTNFDDALEATGLDEENRIRGDTRQEVQAPLVLGIFNVTPYATGRVTAYDQDFDAYAGEDENVRLWGAVGVKAGTSFSQTWDGVESKLLDVHRLRHVVEPSVNLFYAETTIEQERLPVYDYDVESLADGGQIRAGVRNTLQTQRGGEGRWRTVDWIRVETDFIFATDDQHRESPFARFFDYRPEHSLVGDHVWNEVAWQVTEAMAVVADADYSMEENQVERWTAGVLIDHTPRLTSFVQYREIHDADSAIIRYGFEYLLTPKYHIAFANSYDFEHQANRDITISLTRRLPRWLVILTADVDQVEDVVSFGVALAPEGLGGRGSPRRNPFMFDRD